MDGTDETKLYLARIMAQMDIPQIIDIPGVRAVLERELAGQIQELKKNLRLDLFRGKKSIKRYLGRTA